VKQIETGVGAVLDLQGVRRERRLELYRARVSDRMAANRVALETLYQGGTLFSPQGTQTGRALLKARQLLQRAITLVELLAGEGVVPAPRLPERNEVDYAELDTHFSRTDMHTGRDAASVARLPRR
jgi:hypothetical protein